MLHAAARRGDINQARNLVYEGTDPNIRDSSNLTPLHHAAKEGRLEVAGLLLTYGADANAKDDSGSTPLHHAAHNGHCEIAHGLLDYWAEPNAQDGTGATPLHIAAKGKSALFVNLLLDADAKPQVKDGTGSTPLHYATQPDIAQLLLGGEVPISTEVSRSHPDSRSPGCTNRRLALSKGFRHRTSPHSPSRSTGIHSIRRHLPPLTPSRRTTF